MIENLDKSLARRSMLKLRVGLRMRPNGKLQYFRFVACMIWESPKAREMIGKFLRSTNNGISSKTKQ